MPAECQLRTWLDSFDQVPGIRLQESALLPALEMAMITGMHAVVYTRNAEADRAFFRDALGFSSVDAGGGWLIFAAPPSELAPHPAESNGKHELYLRWGDWKAEIARPGEKGIAGTPSATRDGASYPESGSRGGAIWGFTSRITQRLIGRAI